MSILTRPAPAKLNLFLHVTGRRPDGYHELQSVFQFIDWCDEVSVRVRGDGVLQLAEPTPGVVPERDLVLRAARLLKDRSGTRRGADLRVRKRIPQGGGLGGGSSDAATVLVMLNQAWSLDLPPEALADIGLELGADVPVFVRGSAAWAEGIGERLRPVVLDRPWYLIIHPGCQVPTAEIFGAPELTRDSPVLRIQAFFQPGAGASLPAGEVLDLMRRTRNDCEVPARTRYPAVAAALDWLAAHGQARMTGTGACVFAPFAGEADARRVAAALPAGWSGHVARACNRSPLYAAG